MILNTLQLQLCDIQGRLFELSGKKGYESKKFIESYMNSDTAAAFDLPYDRMQWAGEEYILENLLDEVGILPKSDNLFSNDILFWTGYIYRYWHFLTGENSKKIYSYANAQTMRETYLGFHTLDNSLAVENLLEIYQQKNQI